ncbi:hypothetical protein G9A89_004147 [Geosiphon pyriformis]|nr:hypothetical protein G9A89_004147 [Geosiphon pyriformis]
MDSSSQLPYHEKQRLWFCGQHTINNLLQNAAYSKHQLDQIAETLAKETNHEAKTWLSYFINPHKSLLGVGNYDINVIELALRKVGLELQWFDIRKDIRTVIQFADSTLFGLILNIPLTRFFFWKSHHWIAIKPIYNEGGLEDAIQVYNLDSKLAHPHKFVDFEELYKFLEDVVYHKDGQILLSKPFTNPTLLFLLGNPLLASLNIYGI